MLPCRVFYHHTRACIFLFSAWFHKFTNECQSLSAGEIAAVSHLTPKKTLCWSHTNICTWTHINITHRKPECIRVSIAWPPAAINLDIWDIWYNGRNTSVKKYIIVQCKDNVSKLIFSFVYHVTNSMLSWWIFSVFEGLTCCACVLVVVGASHKQKSTDVTCFS